MKKRIYTAPELTIVTVAAERGYASSDETNLRIMRQQLEITVDFNPIKGYTEVNGAGNPFSNDPTSSPSNSFWNF